MKLLLGASHPCISVGVFSHVDASGVWSCAARRFRSIAEPPGNTAVYFVAWGGLDNCCFFLMSL